MKKKLLNIGIVLVLFIITFININLNVTNNDEELDLITINKEALADCEITDWIYPRQYYIDFWGLPCYWTCYTGGYLGCPI